MSFDHFIEVYDVGSAPGRSDAGYANLSRPHVEPSVPALPRTRCIWKTQAHTGRLFERRFFRTIVAFPINSERLDAGVFTSMWVIGDKSQE